MNRNEKIVKLLEDNGFKRQNENFVKEEEITVSKFRSLGNIKVVAYCDFDEEDMEYSNVEFEINYDINLGLDDTEYIYIIDNLSACHEEMCNLKTEIDECVGDEE